MNALACARVRVLLEPYVDGDLAHNDPETARAVGDHLVTCADCRRQHQQAVSLPFRMKALRSPAPRATLVAGVMGSIAPQPQAARAAWGLLVPEALLGAFILWYVSGLDGLTALASGAWSNLQGLAFWGSGTIAAYHLSLLAKLDQSAIPRFTEHRGA